MTIRPPDAWTLRRLLCGLDVNGELDALPEPFKSMGEHLAGLNKKSRSAAWQAMLAAPWFIATDADKAGDKTAAKWPARAIRIRPPKPFNDWAEAAQAGIDLRCWWLPRLGETEALWTHLAAQRRGPVLNDPTLDDGADLYAKPERLPIWKAAVMENTAETRSTHDLCYTIMQQGKSHGRDR